MVQLLTSFCLGSDGTINTISRFLACTLTDSPSCSRTISSQVREIVSYRRTLRGVLGVHQPSVLDMEMIDWYSIALPYSRMHKLTMLSLMKQAKSLDSPLRSIDVGHNLRNWMPGTGASSHFTPCLSDMKKVEEGLDLGVEVADGQIVKCTARWIVEINMIADDCLPLKAHLHGVINVPGLKRCLFFVTVFVQ
jgi:hypothetical protein